MNQKINVPLGKPYTNAFEKKALLEVLASGWLTHGPKNKEFEKVFADYLGVKYALTVNSCASALFLALLAADIKGEVLVPSFTFVASANAIVNAGAKPVWVDIDYNTGNLDPIDAERKITPKTKAIMPVHYAGQSCRMDKIMVLAKKHHLVVIEDSAEAIGTKYKNKFTGSFGLGCFSFFPTKNITTGEGGMLTTNDQAVYEKAKALSGHGIASSTLEREKINRPWLRAATFSGYNFRMSNLLAAIGVEQMKKLDKMNKLRREHAGYLNKGLKKMTDKIDLPVENKNCYHTYQMYTIKLKDPSKREAFFKGMTDRGIGVSVHFDPPVHLQPYYLKNYPAKKGSLPVTEKVSNSIVTLPMYPGLTRKDLDFIIKAVKETVG